MAALSSRYIFTLCISIVEIMKGNTKELFKKYCLEGSILGLKYFYLYPDRVSRCYWTVTMVICAGVAFLMNFLLYRRFKEMPTWMTIENTHEPHDNLPYPAITICSPNQITVSAINNLKKNLVNGNLSADFQELFQQFLGIEQYIHELHFEPLVQLQNIIEQNRYTVLGIIGMLSQRCDDFLKRCIFKEKLYPCEDLFEPVFTKYGMCCIFNGVYHFKDNKRNERKRDFVEHKVTAIGRTQGLSVLMDYNPQDAVDNSVMNAGATKVSISDWSVFPRLDEADLIHPGAEVFNKISFTYNYCSDVVASLPYYSRNCYFADEYSLPHFKEYRNTDCDLSCFIEQVEKQCRCTPLFVPSVSPHRACNLTSLICLKEIKLQMSQIYESGQCSCLRNCESRQYDTEVIIGNLKAMEHLMDNPYSDLVINDTSSLMYFYFPKFVNTKQKQDTVMSVITLGSNLGGVFGLCLGCSFISVLEIWFYIYIAVKNKVKRYLRQRRRRRVTNNNLY